MEVIVPKVLLIALALIFVLLSSCAKRSTEPDTDQVKDYAYQLVKVDYIHLYQNQTSIYNLMNDQFEDADGVPLFPYNGMFYYHPVMIGHRCLWALSDYNMSRDELYLDYVKAGTEALLERAHREENAIYFPYEFDFNPWATTITYTAPWYSGMAQGVLLSVFSRLYYLTEDPYYMAIADSVFNSFKRFDSPKSTVYISNNESLGVGDNYYWVEEYPHEIRRFVLNGSISGSFGLYDYWWVFGDEGSKVLFSRKMTSIKDHVMLYRNPGNISFYCLKFRDLSAFYHALHQRLLNYCYLYTGDSYFSTMSYVLYSDYN